VYEERKLKITGRRHRMSHAPARPCVPIIRDFFDCVYATMATRISHSRGHRLSSERTLTFNGYVTHLSPAKRVITMLAFSKKLRPRVLMTFSIETVWIRSRIIRVSTNRMSEVASIAKLNGRLKTVYLSLDCA